MKIVNAYIKWYNQYGNSPEWNIVVEDVPDYKELRYKQKGSLYFAEKDGLIKFFSWSGPGEGYGGSVFNITMEDGSDKALKGPWSSRAGCMNHAGFKLCTDAYVREENKTGLVSVAILVEELFEIADKLGIYVIMDVNKVTAGYNGKKDLPGVEILATRDNYKELAKVFNDREFTFLPSISPFKVEKDKTSNT